MAANNRGFYYPADEFMGYLMTVDELDSYNEIKCDDLFEGKNHRERIMVFQLPRHEYKEDEYENRKAYKRSLCGHR